jgi:hypothetical protein
MEGRPVAQSDTSGYGTIRSLHQPETVHQWGARQESGATTQLSSFRLALYIESPPLDGYGRQADLNDLNEVASGHGLCYCEARGRAFPLFARVAASRWLQEYIVSSSVAWLATATTFKSPLSKLPRPGQMRAPLRFAPEAVPIGR